MKILQAFIEQAKPPDRFTFDNTNLAAFWVPKTLEQRALDVKLISGKESRKLALDELNELLARINKLEVGIRLTLSMLARNQDPDIILALSQLHDVLENR